MNSANIRIQLTLPDEETQRRRPSFDFNAITSLLSSEISKSPTTTFDPTRTPRLSSLSSSYAQFLKLRDMDKSKKTVRFQF